MKPIAVGDRVRVNWPENRYDKREGTAVEGGDVDGIAYWWINVQEKRDVPFSISRLINLTPDTSELQPGFYWVHYGGKWGSVLRLCWLNIQ